MVSQAAPRAGYFGNGPLHPAGYREAKNKMANHIWHPQFASARGALPPLRVSRKPSNSRPTRSAHPRQVRYATVKPFRYARSAGFTPQWELPHYGNGALPPADLRNHSFLGKAEPAESWPSVSHRHRPSAPQHLQHCPTFSAGDAATKV